ncbi:uncharacterized protein KQ657_002760 [Scheffersomyces spartinae]|uniref:Inheritance of peroxisomes protein 1 n=1 Tax=Scheffersomyces spartinae TaxID=45513 RepID=A0A9P7V5U7_9ASCO|nr:uncharacterized protein KQ657_002760 [Scheffersomyces spartinae]KAG7191795.1 hypothetical protein KQ657_002760 [Scheffersomyces spartinae]
MVKANIINSFFEPTASLVMSYPPPAVDSEGKRSSKRKKKRRNVLAKLNKSTHEPSCTDNSTVTDAIGSPQSQHNNASASAIATTAAPETVPETVPVTNADNGIPRFSASMSPRRQTLLRHKKNEDAATSNYISDLKGGLKSKPTDLSVHKQLDMNKKVTLFKYTSSKILVFDHNLNSTKPYNDLGRLLGHGEFEIFQLHNGGVTYLLCGASFVYPLLPRLKILRVSFNQFLLPLVNPERYWKILINTQEQNVIELLEKTLDKIIRYRNLYFDHGVGKHLDVISELSPSKDDDDNHESGYYNLDMIPIELHNNTSFTNDENNSLTNSNIIWKTIPDSPPSPPISPSQLMISRDNPAINYDWNLDKRKPPSSSAKTSSSIPGFNLGGSLRLNVTNESLDLINTNNISINNQLVAPKPKRFLPQQNHQPMYNDHNHSYQPHYQKSHLKHVDERSDESMDSLLDEYESNMTFTKSITGSRPASRAGSIALASVVRNVTQFPYKLNYKIADQRKGPPTADNEIDLDDDFPTASLSDYSKRIKGGNGAPLSARSRRSSRSDLYSQANIWMDPNKNNNNDNNNNRIRSSNADYSNLYRAIGNRGCPLPDSHIDIQGLTSSPGILNRSTSMHSVRVNAAADVYRMVHPRKSTNMEPSSVNTKNNNADKSITDEARNTKGLSRFFGW